MLRLKLYQIISDRGITAYALWKKSGIAKNTAYALADPDRSPGQVDLTALNKAILAIEEISGQDVLVTDVFEIQHPSEK